MRQKFPGVARRCEMQWRTKSKIWDSVLGRWVKFCHPTTDYIQAMIAYEKSKLGP